ncbi:MAG: N-acetylneuraminate synthase family protein [Myxococcota bacterium]|nr:N-acetylneuraminate synthase family protein [Myxococcota bacterium]
MTKLRLRDKTIGDGYPCYIIGEIGINHNGEMEVAKSLIDVAVKAGCQAVKFQKRTPELCVPKEMWDVQRETPWGMMSYIDYRHRMEFTGEQYAEIASYCDERGIHWFSSCWDVSSVDFMERFDPICYKIASASLTSEGLLKKLKATGRPVLLSTGMSTMDQIRQAVRFLDPENLAIAHCTSAYPCPTENINLRMIHRLKEEFSCPIGYSGHELGLQVSCAAVTLGATFVERHITLDRAMWGSDQSASIEPQGLNRLVRDIRVIEAAMGDGIKRIYESEEPLIKRLRG